MKFYLHFLKSNILYNKVELAISYGLSALVLIGYYLLKNGILLGELNIKNSASEVLISFSFYALLYGFYSNKKKFNLKYLLGLPLSKMSMLTIKSFSDLVFFMPSISLGLIGFIDSVGIKSPLLLLLILIQISLFVSLFMFDSDIEQPRLENARSRFINRLIYVKKAVNFFFAFSFTLFLVLGIYYTSLSESQKLFLFSLVVSFALILKFRKSLQLMKDETLSYFMFKRDAWSLTLKGCLLGVPYIFAFLWSHQQLNSMTSEQGKKFQALMRDKNLKEAKVVLDANHEIKNDKFYYNSTYITYDEFIATQVYEHNFHLHPLERPKWMSFDMQKVFRTKDTSLFDWTKFKSLHHSRSADLFADHWDILQTKEKLESIQGGDKSYKPLFYLASHCQYELLNHILSDSELRKINLTHLKNDRGDNLLHQSIYSRCPESQIAILLSHGVPSEEPNNLDQAPYEISDSYFLKLSVGKRKWALRERKDLKKNTEQKKVLQALKKMDKSGLADKVRLPASLDSD